MAFEIRTKGPEKAPPQIEDRFEGAIHAALALIEKRIPKTRVTVTNLKTGETLNEGQIGEAALAVGPRKRRPGPAESEAETTLADALRSATGIGEMPRGGPTNR